MALLFSASIGNISSFGRILFQNVRVRLLRPIIVNIISKKPIVSRNNGGAELSQQPYRLVGAAQAQYREPMNLRWPDTRGDNLRSRY